MPVTFRYASHSTLYMYMEVSGGVMGSQLPGILVYTKMVMKRCELLNL